jgi:biotin carboxyl carrier protein
MDKTTPFVVNINEKEFAVTPDEISDFDVIEENGFFHVLKNNKSYRAEIVAVDYAEKTFSIKLNGNVYQAKIADKYDRLIKEIGLSVGGTQKLNNIKSPMPGLVLTINVEVGAEVKKGDTLLILEAMKMENVIKAPIDAVVKAIHISKGQAVDKAQLLIEME